MSCRSDKECATKASSVFAWALVRGLLEDDPKLLPVVQRRRRATNDDRAVFRSGRADQGVLRHRWRWPQPDAMAIWIVQFIGRAIRVLDHIEGKGQQLSYHAHQLRSPGSL